MSAVAAPATAERAVSISKAVVAHLAALGHPRASVRLEMDPAHRPFPGRTDVGHPDRWLYWVQLRAEPGRYFSGDYEDGMISDADLAHWIATEATRTRSTAPYGTGGTDGRGMRGCGWQKKLARRTAEMTGRRM